MGQNFRLFPREALDSSIPARFAGRVAEAPERLAVKNGARALSYGELDRLSNGIAHAIVAQAGATSEPVVLLIEQGVSLVVAILGALKAGKIYVPLDPSYPAVHLETQIASCRPRLVLTTRSTRSTAEALGLEPPCVLEIDSVDMSPSDVALTLAIPPDAGACIYYTSGSTGRPKGVLDSHRNVLHNVLRYTNTLRISPDDRLTLLQGPSFSGAVSSLFSALLNGASIFPFDVPRAGADRIGPWLEHEKITIYHSVPALFRRVTASGAQLHTLRLVRLEGDQASPRDVSLFRQHLPRGAMLVNGLGATECGLARQFFIDHDTAVPEGVVPIGYPVPDMEVSLIDEAGEAVPSGEVGEITVTSRFLAVGYWGEPEMTATAFRMGPRRGDARTYRTGDLGRLRPDGCLEHLGRKDFQLKIGGNRVDAAAVEAALLAVSGVNEATVATREGPGGEARLIAYLVASRQGALTAGAIRRQLAARFPPFMVPSAYVMMDALPLNANAKVDRRALPLPPPGRPVLDSPYRRPANFLQQELTAVWEAVLGVTPIGIRDDFFDLGGSSLLALRMVDEVERRLGRRVNHTTLAACSTVEQLADAIQRDSSDRAAPIVVVQRGDGRRPPFFFLHGDYVSGGFYCTELARRLGAEQAFYVLPPHGLGTSAIPDSYEAMAEHHVEALRSVQPQGPYRLAGTCSGGLVALEMARRLLRNGERVDRLILIAASAINVRWRLSHGPIATLGSIMRRGSAERFDVFLDFVKCWDAVKFASGARLLLRKIRALRDSGQLMTAPWLPASGLSASRRATRAVYRRIDKDYTPAPYESPVTVLWPSDDLEFFTAGRWWKLVSPDVDFRAIPGSHLTSLTVHVDALAAEIRRCLAEDGGGESRASGASAARIVS